MKYTYIIMYDIIICYKMIYFIYIYVIYVILDEYHGNHKPKPYNRKHHKRINII